MLHCLVVRRIGVKPKVKIERTRANSPPNLLGIDHRIAYAYRKYHPGSIHGDLFEGICWDIAIGIFQYIR